MKRISYKLTFINSRAFIKVRITRLIFTTDLLIFEDLVIEHAVVLA